MKTLYVRSNIKNYDKFNEAIRSMRRNRKKTETSNLVLSIMMEEYDENFFCGLYWKSHPNKKTTKNAYMINQFDNEFMISGIPKELL